MKTANIKLKLYLEGVPVNFTSISITEQINSAPIAIITMPPVYAASKLYPKTMAHVFYQHKFSWEETGDPQYYLIFEGELHAHAFAKTPNGQNVQLTFVGLTSNWQRTYKTIVDFSLDTLMTGKFFMIGGKPLVSNSTNAAPTPKDEKVKKLKDKGYWMITGLPATSIAARLQQTFSKFVKGSEAVKKTMQSLLTNLADSNPYYHRIHKLYKFNERVEALENPSLKTTLRGQTMAEMFRGQISNMRSTETGSGMLKHLMDRMEYFYIEPAAPTLGEGGIPKSIFFVPETMFMMPLRCNTFFPNDVNSSNYQHNYEGEPTRYVISTPTLAVSNSAAACTYSMQSKFIVPAQEVYTIEQEAEEITETINGKEVKIRLDHDKMPAIGMLHEEMIRGIQPELGQYTSAEQVYVQFVREATGGETETSPLTEDAFPKRFAESGLGSYIQKVAMFKYLKKRFATRQFSFNAIYNPTRMIGFPAIVIDPKLPATVGKIESIHSHLSADGQGFSSIVLSYPRTIREYDFPDEDYTQPWNDNSLVFDDYTDIWPAVPFWIDPSKYGVRNVGDTLKPIVFPDSPDGVTLDFHLGETKIPDSGDETRNNVNTAAKALFELNKKYNIYKDDRHIFTDKEIKRKLVTEKEFWNFFVGADIPDDTHYDSVHDMNYSAKTRVFKYNPDKQFLKERRTKVLAILEELKEVQGIKK